MAHGDFVYWKGFHELLSDLEEKRPSYLAAVQALFQVFSLSILQNPHHPSLANALPLSQTQHKYLRLAKSAAIEHLASKHLADVIDAYGFTEYELDSALARSDKEPYQALFEEGAQRSEMSGTGMSHLWPMMVDTRHMWKKIEAEKAGQAKL